MTKILLNATGLTRRFGSPESGRLAVNGVDLAVQAGEIHGLVGPNGAGKTTTVRMCSTMLAPTSGSIEVCGVDALAKPRAARRHIGLVLGGERGFYLRASARDNLLFFADVLGVPRRERAGRIAEALSATGLADRAADPVEAYSRGMRQRLHIARGLLHNPEILLLDEPTNGLDPEISEEIRSLVQDLAQQGRGIVLTTHMLTEMEALAHQITVIMEGTVKVRGTTKDIAHAAGVSAVTNFSLALDSQVDATLGKLRAHPAAVRVASQRMDSRYVCSVSWGTQGLQDAPTAIPGALDEATRPPTLEECYLALVKGVSHA